MTKRTNTKSAPQNNDSRDACGATDPLRTMLTAWERTRDRREAIPAQEAPLMRLDLTTAVIAMRGAHERLLPMRERIVGEFASFDARNFDELPTYCAAATYANARYVSATTVGPEVAIVDVVANGEKQSAKMMRAYASLADAGLVSLEALAAIREGKGWRSLSERLHALVALGLARWEEIKKASILRDEDLALASSLGEAIVRHFARKSKTKAASEAQIDRRRALTLAVRAYEEVRRAVQWVRWHEGDADELAPSLYAPAFGRSARRAEAEEKNEGGAQNAKEKGAERKPAA